MEVVTLYRYERETGKFTVSPNKPDYEYTVCYRVIADENKAVTLDGVNLYSCVDTDIKDDWYEVDQPEEEMEEAAL